MMKPSVVGVNTLRNKMEHSDAAVANPSVAPAGPLATSPRGSVPSKRPKQVTPVAYSKRLCFPKMASILDYISDDALLAQIFSWAGPSDTARCARVCSTWHAASWSHPCLWRNFAAAEFGLTVVDPVHHPVDWCGVYSFLGHRRTMGRPHQSLHATVVFADDGGNFPGYPAQHALLPSKAMVWCTNTGADRNVDLVLRLNQTCLVTGLVAANGGRGYSAPLKEGLVFCSLHPPDLESTKCYNVVDQSSSEGGLGSAWVQHLFRPASREEPPEPTNNAVNNDNATRQDDPVQEETPISNSWIPPSPRPPTHPGAPTPVAAFSFPHLAAAYAGQSHQILIKPLVARYIHFKLLTSHSPPGLEHISDNIDLMHFHPHGIPIPDLDSLVGASLLNNWPPPPSYQRQHALRATRDIVVVQDQVEEGVDIENDVNHHDP